MEPKLICTAAASALWATLPLQGISRENLFALHDADHSFADNLIVEMKLLEVGLLTTEDADFAISGPLSPNQAAVLDQLSGLGLPVYVVKPSEDGAEVEYVDGGEAVLNAAEQELGAAHEPDQCEACLTEAVNDFIRDMGLNGIDLKVENGVFVPDEGVEVDPGHPEYDCERAEILLDATNTVTLDRNDQYGEPENSFPMIADLWSAYLGADITPEQVAWMMVLLKAARAENGYKRDNYIDAAGYVGIAGELALDETTAPTIH